MDELIHLPRVLRIHPFGDVEVLHHAADAGGERSRIEVGDGTDAGTAVDDAVPRRCQVVTQWRHGTHAGNHYASLRHETLRTLRREDRQDCDSNATARSARLKNTGPQNAAPVWFSWFASDDGVGGQPPEPMLPAPRYIRP